MYVRFMASADTSLARLRALRQAFRAIACIPNEYLGPVNEPVDDTGVLRQWERWREQLRAAAVHPNNDLEHPVFDDTCDQIELGIEDVRTVIADTKLMHQLEQKGRVRRDSWRASRARNYRLFYTRDVEPLGIREADALFDRWLEVTPSFTRSGSLSCNQLKRPRAQKDDEHPGLAGGVPTTGDDLAEIAGRNAANVLQKHRSTAAYRAFVRTIGPRAFRDLLEVAWETSVSHEIVEAVAERASREAEQYVNALSKMRHDDFIDSKGDFIVRAQESSVRACEKLCPLLFAVLLAVATSNTLARRGGSKCSSLQSQNQELAQRKACLSVHLELIFNLRYQSRRPLLWPAVIGFCLKLGGMSKTSFDIVSALQLSCGRTTARGMLDKMATRVATQLRHELRTWPAVRTQVPLIIADNWNPLRFGKVPTTDASFTRITSTVTVLTKLLPVEHAMEVPIAPANAVIDVDTLRAILEPGSGWKAPTFRSESPVRGCPLHSFRSIPSLSIQSSSYNAMSVWVTGFLLGKVLGLAHREVAFLGDPEPISLTLRQTIAASEAGIDDMKNVIVMPPVWHMRMHGLVAHFCEPAVMASIWLPFLASAFDFRRAEWLKLRDQLLTGKGRLAATDIEELFAESLEDNEQEAEFEEASTTTRKRKRAAVPLDDPPWERIAQLTQTKSSKLRSNKMAFEKLCHVASILATAFEAVQDSLSESCQGGPASKFLWGAFKELLDVWIAPYREWVGSQDGRGVEEWVNTLPAMCRLFAYYSMPRVTRTAMYLLSNVARWSERRPDILQLMRSNSPSINDVHAEHTNSLLSRQVREYNSLTSHVVKRESVLALHAHRVLREVRESIGLQTVNGRDETSDVESRHLGAKFSSAIDKAKTFIVSLFRSANKWEERHERSSSCWNRDRQQIGYEQIVTYHIKKYQEYENKVRREEARLRELASSEPVVRLLFSQQRKTLQALCQAAGTVVLATKALLVAELSAAGFTTEEAIRNLAARHNIELRESEDANDLFSLLQRGRSIDIDSHFSITTSR